MTPTLTLHRAFVMDTEFENRRTPITRFRRTVLGFLAADALLLLFLTYGSVFPSRMSIPEVGQSMPEQYYDYSAKSSPFEVPKDTRRAAAQPIPKISARSVPLVASADTTTTLTVDVDRNRTM